MLQTCAGEALTTMLALMVRLFNPVTAMATSEAPAPDDEGDGEPLRRSLAICMSIGWLRTAGGDGRRSRWLAGTLSCKHSNKHAMLL